MTGQQRAACRTAGALVTTVLLGQGLVGQWALAVLVAVLVDLSIGWGRWA